jgi:outer membrane protease
MIKTNLFLCIIFLYFFTSTAVFSQNALQIEAHGYSVDHSEGKENVFSLNIGPDAGMMFGMLQEWVFINRDGRTSFDDVYSRLDWQLNPLAYVGATGSLMPLPRFFIGFGGWLGIPGLLGYEEDSDWDLITGVFSTFSHLDNKLSNAVFLDLNTGYSFIYQTHITFNGIIGFNLKQFHMIAQDGWQEMPPGSNHVQIIGAAIDYELNYFIPYLAGELAWTPVNWLTIDLFLSVSPFLTFVYDRDFHILRDLTFQDLPQFGFSLASVLSLSIQFGAGFSLRVKNGFQWAPPFKGYDYVDGTRDTGSRGGSSLIIYSLSLSLNYAISAYAPHKNTDYHLLR